jgi:hypothetical protein
VRSTFNASKKDESEGRSNESFSDAVYQSAYAFTRNELPRSGVRDSWRR